MSAPPTRVLRRGRSAAAQLLSLASAAANSEEDEKAAVELAPPAAAPQRKKAGRKAGKKLGRYKHLTQEQRTNIINWHNLHGYTVPKILQLLQPNTFSYQTVRSVLKQYEKTQRMEPLPRGGAHNNKLQPGDKEKIVELVDRHNGYTLNQIAQQLQQSSGTKVSPTTVSTVLRQVNYSCKRTILLPAARNTPENIRRRADFSEWIVAVEREQLVFLDEAGFNLHMNRGRGWSQKGRRAVVHVPADRKRNVSVIGAISPTRGLLKFDVFTGATTGDIFSNFFSELLREPAFQVRSHCFVMDNGSAHKKAELQVCCP